METTTAGLGSTRTRLLEATGIALAQYGPRKLSLTGIAALAGVSRPTLYRHFASREELLLALAEYEKERFRSELSAVLDGLSGRDRLDRALRFVADVQRERPWRGLVAIEPGFMLGQLERALRSMTPALVPLFEELQVAAPSPAQLGPADAADLVVRTALSHVLIGGEDGQLLRELRHVARRPD